MKSMHTYTIYCSIKDKKQLQNLCDVTHMSYSDIIKATFLFSSAKDFEDVILQGTITEYETILIKSGTNVGKIVRQRPQIQVVLPYKLPVHIVKKALILALQSRNKKPILPTTANSKNTPQHQDIAHYIKVCKSVLPDPIPSCKTPRQALHILGFAPDVVVQKSLVKARYHTLLKIFHPDTGGEFADKKRLLSIQQAWAMLKDL